MSVPSTSPPSADELEFDEAQDTSYESANFSGSDTEASPRSTASAEDQSWRPSSDWLRFMIGDEALNTFPEELLQQLAIYCKQNKTTDLHWAMKPGPGYTKPTFMRGGYRKAAKFVVSGCNEVLDAALYGYHTTVPGVVRRLVIVRQKSQNSDVPFNNGSPAIIVKDKNTSRQGNEKEKTGAYWSIWKPVGPLTRSAVRWVVGTGLSDRSGSRTPRDTSSCETSLASDKAVDIKTAEEDIVNSLGSQTDTRTALQGHTKPNTSNKADGITLPSQEPYRVLSRTLTKAMNPKLASLLTAVARKAEGELEPASARQKRMRLTRSHTKESPTTPETERPLILSSIEKSQPSTSAPPDFTSSQETKSLSPTWQISFERTSTLPNTTVMSSDSRMLTETPTKSPPISDKIKAPTMLNNFRRTSQTSSRATDSSAGKVVFTSMRNENEPVPRMRDLADCDNAQKLFAQARCARIATKDSLVLQIQIDEQDPRVIMCGDEEDYQDMMSEIRGRILKKDKNEYVEVIVMAEE